MVVVQVMGNGPYLALFGPIWPYFSYSYGPAAKMVLSYQIVKNCTLLRTVTK